MTSSETLRCKECGIIFNTVEDLYEHQKSGTRKNVKT